MQLQFHGGRRETLTNSDWIIPEPLTLKSLLPSIPPLIKSKQGKQNEKVWILPVVFLAGRGTGRGAPPLWPVKTCHVFSGKTEQDFPYLEVNWLRQVMESLLTLVSLRKVTP